MIKFDSVTKRYSTDITALEDICFEIPQGDFCFVMGPSGAGKTTLMKLLIREELPSEGTIFFKEIEVPKLPRKLIPTYRQKIGMVFQDIRLLESKTLEENIAFALEIVGKSTSEISKTTDYLLDLVELKERKNLFPKELSGGEQQRGAIARALANTPELLLADEPTGNLDKENSALILKILQTINDTGTTVMVVTHNMDLINGSKKRLLHLEKGKLMNGEKPQKKADTKEEVKEEIKEEVKEEKTSLDGLPKPLKKKFEKIGITDTEGLLDTTEKQMKSLNLNKKELNQLEGFVKDYLSNKK